MRASLFGVCVIVAGLGLGQVAAAADVVAEPAELPPASFADRYFVDSKGCMFIRAGTDGHVQWVPRVDKRLSQVCGFAPSLAGGQAVMPVVAAAPKVVAPLAPVPSPAVTVTPAIPKGYKSAWSDGRLNPQRGPRTPQGDASMALIWSDDVPMRRR